MNTPLIDAHSDLFREEHRTLDHVLADVEYLADRRSFQSAAKRLGEFRRDLEEHIRDEEDVLLVLYVKKTGDRSHLAERVRKSHAQLLRAVDEAARALSQGHHDHFFEAGEKISCLLLAHQDAERHVLHPALDAALPNRSSWVALKNWLRHAP